MLRNRCVESLESFPEFQFLSRFLDQVCDPSHELGTFRLAQVGVHQPLQLELEMEFLLPSDVLDRFQVQDPEETPRALPEPQLFSDSVLDLQEFHHSGVPWLVEVRRTEGREDVQLENVQEAQETLQERCVETESFPGPVETDHSGADLETFRIRFPGLGDEEGRLCASDIPIHCVQEFRLPLSVHHRHRWCGCGRGWGRGSCGWGWICPSG